MSEENLRFYTIRYFAGKTVRFYHKTDGLVNAGEKVVMERLRPVARFFKEVAAEVFCKDYVGTGWLVRDDPFAHFNPTPCPMCHKTPMAIVHISEGPPSEVEKICRYCGFHSGHTFNGPTKTAVESQPG